MKDQRVFFLLLAIVIGAGIILGFLVSYFSSRAYPLHRNIALLYVGKDTTPPAMAAESEVQKLVTEKRDTLKIFSSDLPFYSYHYDKESEKKVCADTFNISPDDLPFLGVVEMDEKTLPVKVLFRMRYEKEGGESLDNLIAAALMELKGAERSSPSRSIPGRRN
jgi:hypothetical protein